MQFLDGLQQPASPETHLLLLRAVRAGVPKTTEVRQRGIVEQYLDYQISPQSACTGSRQSDRLPRELSSCSRFSATITGRPSSPGVCQYISRGRPHSSSQEYQREIMELDACARSCATRHRSKPAPPRLSRLQSALVHVRQGSTNTRRCRLSSRHAFDSLVVPADRRHRDSQSRSGSRCRLCPRKCIQRDG